MNEDERQDDKAVAKPGEGFRATGAETPFGPAGSFGALTSESYLPPAQRDPEVGTPSFATVQDSGQRSPDWDPYLLVDPSIAPEHAGAARPAGDTTTQPIPPVQPGPAGPQGGDGSPQPPSGSGGPDDRRRTKVVIGVALGLLVLAAVAFGVAQSGGDGSPNTSSSPAAQTGPTPLVTYSPTPTSSPDAEEPSPSVSPTPTATSDGGHDSTVLGDDVNLRNGPSSHYASIGVVNSGDSVTVLCTGYGEPIGDASNRLWDYTSGGWIADHYLNTGTTQPTEPGCTGDVNSPSVGSAESSAGHGPFPILTVGGSSVDTRSDAGSGGSTVSSVSSGEMVYVQCTRSADEVDGPGGANSDWDQLADGTWVPDALVDTQTNGSPAPTC